MSLAGISIIGSIISGNFLDFSFPINLGSSKSLHVGFDTAFSESYFIVSSSKSKSENLCDSFQNATACNPYYSASASSSFKVLPPFNAPPVFFNEEIKGRRGKDTLQLMNSSLGDITIPDTTFTLVNESLIHSPSSSHGMIGIGFRSPFLANMKDKGLISNQLVGFSVSEDDTSATLDLGFWNLKQIETMNNLTTMQLKNDGALKQTVMPFGVLISNVYLDDGLTSRSIIPQVSVQDSQNVALIRTARSISYFPSSVMMHIVEATNATRSNSSLLYSVSCLLKDKFPTLISQFTTANGGVFNATWKPEEYIFQYSNTVDPQKNCFLGMTENPGLAFTDFFLSLGLLRKYYIGLDGDNEIISLGSYSIMNLTNPVPTVPDDGRKKPHENTPTSSSQSVHFFLLSFCFLVSFILFS